MKALILNGSPRINGDTVQLIRRLTDAIAKASPEDEIRIVDAYRCDISPCIDCRYCREHPGCTIDDEMRELYDYICDCDNIVIASPIYYCELTGRLLDLGSRLQTYFSARRFRGEEPIKKPKRGAVILVGGGDGNVNRPYTTAKLLLKTMGCAKIYEVVASHNTDNIPAGEDEKALFGVELIAEFLTAPRQVEVELCESADDRLLEYAVIVARCKGKWVFCKHKSRDTYEIPGGHREPGESIDEAARRELYEETGALEYTLKPLCSYSVTSPESTKTFGMLYFAEISEYEPELHSEIERIILTHNVPERESEWTYPQIQPILFTEAIRREFL